MTRKIDTGQRQRFEEASRAAECDESPEAFERVFAKVVPPKKGGDVASKPLPIATKKSQ
jgi:hypothetical protein